ncbi:DUF1684 domain-containing protein [Amycolatopsis endophytica]|uniref:DUF1684 domain-containing protein n=1 Tax=Amycolatopsis endophytica TaxID=860233 RepID=A0A853BBM6_9PSEU|nr:DUF1684 domain-containing protein [Amycolatopsis endophytica]NYI92087.1 hypothetical protein [Amycolatopsis endophytica]
MTFAEDWRAWRAMREEVLAEPHGWLSITARHWLTAEPRRFDGIPGTWHEEGGAAVVSVGPGEEFEVSGTHRFELVNSGPGEMVQAGERVVEVARRGGYLLRLRDPAAPVRRAFRGVPAFEPDPGWVLSGRFEPFGEPRAVTVGAVVEGLSHVYSSPGVLRFAHGGGEFALTAFNGKGGAAFSVLFTDATSGVTTYAANRSLSVAAPDARGEVELDFNRAVNLPCAFIDLATCPLPPPENRLPFPVEAGERIPYERR